jgi:pSer/pThr/pTyr-binding forkhead associated (FHA) protein
VDAPGTITRLLRELDDVRITADEREPSVVASAARADRDQPAPVPTRITEQRAPEPPSIARALLVATAGPARGKTFVVTHGSSTIGRVPEDQVYIPDERLSREHARIEFRDGRYWLRDLSSMNGTALNGHLLSQEEPLQMGDTIELGSSTLVVTTEPAPTS